jgi:hypothetical protein
VSEADWTIEIPERPMGTGSWARRLRQGTPETNAKRKLERSTAAGEADRIYAALRSAGAIADRHRRMTYRCPTNGHKLLELYSLDLAATAAAQAAVETRRLWLVVAHTLKVVRAGWLDWPYSDSWSGPDTWWPIACDDGSGKIGRAFAAELVESVRSPESDPIDMPVDTSQGAVGPGMSWKPKSPATR